MKLCSVIFPSRMRVQRCRKSIESLFAGQDANQIEILIRCDHDDSELNAYHGLTLIFRNVNLLVGPRGAGYSQISKYFDELNKHVQTEWVLQWNDDIIMQPGPWLKELAKVPTTGFWAHCEIHKLGFSTYPRNDDGPAIFHPSNVLEVLGRKEFPKAPDSDTANLLRAIGWKCHFLPGCAYHHQRDNEVALEEHRR